MVNYVGDGGPNVQDGTPYKDTLDGQGGNDSLRGLGGNDYILGRAGNDTLGGQDGRDTLLGGLDNDLIIDTGDDDADVLDGMDGADLVYGSRKDSLQGGAGSDFFQLELSGSVGMNVDLTGLTSGGSITFARTTISGFESGLIRFGDGDDKVRAPSMDVLLWGEGGADTLLGGVGDDQIFGGVGQANDADVLKGGGGDDQLNGGAGDIIDGGEGSLDRFNLYLGSSDFDFDSDFSPLASGGTAYVGLGTRVARCELGVVQFGSGDDRVEIGTLAGGLSIRIYGDEGNDTLIGGDNNDTLSPGLGNDVIRGGAGADLADYLDGFSSTPLTIDLEITTWQDTGGGGVDLLLGVEHLFGMAGGDALIGNAENNVFDGWMGDDTLFGRQGDDVLNGGSIAFNPLMDVDRLSGGAGQDTYDGGAGNDVLVWTSTLHTTLAAPDQVLGLEDEDVIHLAAIDADTTVAGDQAFTIVGALSGAAGQLAVVFSGARTQWRMDVNGDGVADGLIEAAGDHTGHAEYVL